MTWLPPLESALSQARHLDEERRQGIKRNGIHRLPILVKDSIETDPDLGMPTAAGTYALGELMKAFKTSQGHRIELDRIDDGLTVAAESHVPGNAAVIDQLLKRGAIGECLSATD